MGCMKNLRRKQKEQDFQEVEEHQIAHVPFRSWCAHCVRGKAHSTAHPRSAGEKLPDRRQTIAMDYFFLGKKEESSMPILGVVEEATLRSFSITLPCKGLEHQYNLAALMKAIKVLGVQFGVLKSDTERSIVALRDAALGQFPNMSYENATKGESQSNGLIESMIGKLEGQVRTLKSALQERYDVEINPKHPILPWLVDYAGVTLSRSQRGADGRTPYERSTGKPWRIQVPEFGECVLYQPLKGEKVGSKMEPKFEPGIYLGLQEGSALKWVGTSEGVVRSWSLKRRTESERWDVEALNNMIGLPWQLKPPKESLKQVAHGPVELKIDLQPPPESAPKSVVERRRRDYVPRGIYIRKDVELEEFGYTDGCDGCFAAQNGLSHRQHSRACKARIRGELEKSEEGRKRLELLKQREEKFMVRVHEEEEEKKKRKAGEDSEAKSGPPKVSRGAEDAGVAQIDDILGEAVSDLINQGQSSSSSAQPMSQGGPSGVDSAIAGGSVEETDQSAGAGPSGVVDAEMEGDEPLAQQNMEIGLLIKFVEPHSHEKVDLEFVHAVREISYLETVDMVADEEVMRTKIDLQTGSVGLAEAYVLTKPKVAELYSRPRITDYGKRKGILSGIAFDLTINDEDGNPWDFRLKGQRDRAARAIDELCPELLVGSPMCGPFSNLQNLNVKTEEAKQSLEEKEREGTMHLEFCVEQYEAQMRRGGYFLHEHPQSARSWKLGCIERLASKAEVFKVTGDMCRHGMISVDSVGEGLVKKPTTFLTNSAEIADALALRCDNDKQAVGLWRRTDDGLQFGVGPGAKGPSRSQVVRRISLDLTNQVVLQDLMDANNAPNWQWKFAIPKACKRVETVFHYVKPGYLWHRHVPLTDGRAKHAEIYPEGLVRAIIDGLLRQLKKQRPAICGLSLGPINQEDDIDFSWSDGGSNDEWETFVDEVSGKALNSKLVAEAKAEELDYAARYNVWDLVPVSECWKETGAGPIGSRWININKGDEQRPNYRSRLVIQEVRHSGIEAIFAATPPLESIRFLLSLQRSTTEKLKVMFIDIRRAHWTATIQRKVYVRLPKEVCDPSLCGRLNKAMYGCRDAAQCWEMEITDFFTTHGFTPGIGSPVLFVNLVRDLRVSIHGDDITALGKEPDLLWLKEALETRYELKYGGMLGPDSHDVKDATILNRLIHFGEEETTYESDPRHVQILVRELGLQDAKDVVTPGVTRKFDPESALLSVQEVSRYRSLVMRANYLSLDRPDVSYTAKELARKMSEPNQDDWVGLKRLVRFLHHRARLVWSFRQQPEPDSLRMFSDSDDGGCTRTRKSTSCGVLMHGDHLVKFYSSTQHVVALSSGESEFYAGICAGSALIGARSMAEDLGVSRFGTLLFDATAAKAMLTRKGFGRAKHIHRSYLWLQQRIDHRDFKLNKVGTKNNPADLGTKHLEGPRVLELLKLMNLRYEKVEHEMALHV